MCVPACHCSGEGSRYTSCDQVTGQCVCLPNVVGLRCDSCAHGSYGFPNCQGNNAHRVNTAQILCVPKIMKVRCDSCSECDLQLNTYTQTHAHTQALQTITTYNTLPASLNTSIN